MESLSLPNDQFSKSKLDKAASAGSSSAISSTTEGEENSRYLDVYISGYLDISMSTFLDF